MNIRSAVIWLLGILGVVISYAKFIEWATINGFQMLDAWKDAFSGSPFSVGLVWDLSISAVMLVVLAFWDRKRLGNRWAIGVALSTSILGVCLGLAFYAVGLSRPKEVETA
jgi:hypothetical protein